MKNRKAAFPRAALCLALCLMLLLCASLPALAQEDAPGAPDINDYRGGYDYQPSEADTALLSGILPRAEAMLRDVTGEEDVSAYSSSCVFRMDEDRQTRWWLVTFTQFYGEGEDVKEGLIYSVAFVLGDAPFVVSETKADYQRHLQDIENELLYMQNEKENGPFYTWSLEMKASTYPDWCALPRQGDIAQDAALAIARGYLKTEYGMTEADLDIWHPFYYFTMETLTGETTQRFCWRIDFYTDEGMASPQLDGYAVFIDAATGKVVAGWEPGGNG